MPSVTRPSARIPIPQAVGACTGFAAFTVSVIVGISSSNPVETVLSRALLAMAAAFAGGFLLGLVCDWIVSEEVARIEDAVQADAEDRAAREVDLDGLTGVDVLEDDVESMASRAVRTENRDAVGRRREKNAA